MDLVRAKEKYPTANVPGARTIQEVMRKWETEELVPTEMTEEDFRQFISIVCDAWKGSITWKSDNLNGISILALMADTMYNMFHDIIKSPNRPKIHPGDCQIHIALKDNRMGIVFDRNKDPQLIKGMLIAALWHIIDQFKKPEDCNPFDEFMGCFEFNVE